MLAYFLAIAIGLGSLILYLTAFFSPKIHRQDDFLWSGVGLFYALALWVCAGQMRGGVLLGQAAAALLLLVLGWQTLQLRRALAYPERQADLEGFSLTRWLRGRLGKKPSPPPVQPPLTETKTAAAAAPAPPMAAPEKAIEPEIATVGEEGEMAVEEETRGEEKEEIVTEPQVELQGKKGFSLKDLLPFGKGKPAEKPETIREALEAIETESASEESEEIEGESASEEITGEEAEEEGKVTEIPTATVTEEVSLVTEAAEPVPTEEVTSPTSPEAIEEHSEEIETLFELSAEQPEAENKEQS